MAHTPGPWSRFDNGGTVESGHTYGASYADVVWGPEGPGRGVIADFSPHDQPPTVASIANAQLASAAPELLQSVEDFLIHLSMGWELDGLIDAANAAYRKAWGESA